jgi:HTH-type transcriptional repressor of NAD biosynthesis genes
VTGDHGLVIGKFYPPHAGHHLLVRTASRACRRVSVVVMASAVESIPLDLRVAWMREVHAADANVSIAGVADELAVDYEDDAIWQGHVASMRQALATNTGEPVTAVFTAERYGPELARRFGARHVDVDGRALVAVSGTAVRRDPVANWEHLAPCVRAHLARRIVLVGAESTGKTTLAAEIALSLRRRGGSHGLSRWVPEYGRERTVANFACARARAALEGRAPPSMEELEWPTSEFVHIAKVQAEREESEARLGGPVLLCDTDAFATAVWHRRYAGNRSREVEELASDPARRLYLLTHPDDVPFDQDGLRDGEHLRHRMTDWFVEQLEERGAVWSWLRGDREERSARALESIDALLAAGSGLADPLG